MQVYALLMGFLIVLVTIGTSEANVVNYVGNANHDYLNMGTVVRGQKGTILSIYGNITPPPPYTAIAPSSPNLAFSGFAYGVLPAMSKIVFSYSVQHMTQGYLQAGGQYSYTGNGFYGMGLYSGSSFADSHVQGTTDIGLYNSNPALPLVWAAANFTVDIHGGSGDGTGTGTTTIQNNSNTAISFQSLFSGLFKDLPSVTNGKGVGMIKYSVSAVPLPASLPLFAALIAGMVGVARFKRRHKTVMST